MCPLKGTTLEYHKNKYMIIEPAASKSPAMSESLPYQVLRASCLAQSRLSSPYILCVRVQVWWDLLEDGRQLLSHKLPMQTLVVNNTKTFKGTVSRFSLFY